MTTGTAVRRLVVVLGAVVTLACLTWTAVLIQQRGGPLMLIPGAPQLLLDKPDPHAQTADQLRRILSAIPVPHAARLVDEQVVEATFERQAFVRRTYSYPAGDGASAGVLAVLDTAGLVPLEVDGLGDRTGQLRVLPPGLSGEGATVSWDGKQLQVELLAGRVR